MVESGLRSDEHGASAITTTATTPPPALSMPHLPTELIDYIVDFHHSDRKTLSACSFVCRNWLPASRFHLLGSIDVRKSNVHSFAELLASPSSTITSCVHTIDINTSSFGTPVFDIIAPYFKDLVAVKSITLYGWGMAPVSEENLSRGFGRIGNMELTRITFDSHSGWFSLTFTLSNSGPFTFASRLRVIHSITHDIESLSWQPIVADIPYVGEINLHWIRDSHLPTVQAMLKSGGPSVHTIKFSFAFRQSTLGTSESLWHKYYHLLLVYSIDWRKC
jgi:hypothetical protein